eukprot:TRINITY_DN649_c0_g2_i2.p1 TRINITY_DN649_c0_g2~~TRINITY_DN649_c0_g2_i2.p1  ORF type:complete len:216 (+),score=45.41 TRINITY_DN649_c0_g2_i2:41-688(+)
MDFGEFDYKSCYCEENVYRLCCFNEKFESLKYLGAIFISNLKKCVPILYQKASESPETRPVFWDYHVIFIFVDDDEEESNDKNEYELTSFPLKKWKVIDIDCAFKKDDGELMTFDEYTKLSFPTIFFLNEQIAPYKPMFRFVPKQQLITEFSSDRSHMKKKTDDEEGFEWLAEPPEWDLIYKENKGNILMSHFVNMEYTEVGYLYNFEDILTLIN